MKKQRGRRRACTASLGKDPSAGVALNPPGGHARAGAFPNHSFPKADGLVRVQASRSRNEESIRRGLSLESEGRLDEAWAAFAQALERDPSRLDVANRMAVIRVRQRRVREAEEGFHAVLARDPTHGEALANLGNLLRSQGRLDEAAAWCLRAIRMDPTNAAAHTNLASTLLEAGRLEEAAAAVRNALEYAPVAFEPLNTLGAILHRQGRLAEAEEVLSLATDLAPDAPSPRVNLGLTLHDQGRVEEALSAFGSVLELDPSYIDAHTGAGAGFLTLGRFEEAAAHFRAALDMDPAEPSALHGLAELGAMPPDDAEARLREVLTRGPPAPGPRMLIHFWLARRADQAGDYDEAFRQLHEGHKARRVHLNHAHDEAADRALFRSLQEAITHDFFGERADWGFADARPIFVVGMPRSGTSLVEQILASHSRVYGAGELNRLPKLVRELVTASPINDDPRRVRHLSREVARDVGRAYLATLTEVGGGAERVVDKMPHNFKNLWLIALLFPNATVLHTVRSPLDTCVSCYFQNFSRHHAYTDDLRWLGAHYGFYRRLMEHWKNVLPIPIHDVHYEELVARPEEEIPALVEASGLAFEPACLSFHETERAVRTASVTQVRKKVYTRSVERWRRYAGHLGPLGDALSAWGVEVPDLTS